MFGLGSLALGLLGRVPGVGKFLGSKWFWIILAVIGVVWFVDHTIDEYGDRIRDQITTQLRANEFKNRAETLQVELEGMTELRDEQQERISELTAAREADQIEFNRRLRRLQNSNLEGGQVGEFLVEAARQSTRPDGVPFEDYVNANEADPEN